VETEKGKRDRAILSVLLYHGLRREELCTLKVRDIHGTYVLDPFVFVVVTKARRSCHASGQSRVQSADKHVLRQATAS
jgi:site-specific recombinase XerD